MGSFWPSAILRSASNIWTARARMASLRASRRAVGALQANLRDLLIRREAEDLPPGLLPGHRRGERCETGEGGLHHVAGPPSGDAAQRPDGERDCVHVVVHLRPAVAGEAH